MMILDLDIGNSSAKWRLGECSGTAGLVPGESGHVDLKAGERPPKSLANRIERVRISNVSSLSLDGVLSLFDVADNVPVDQARVGEGFPDLHVAYAEPSTLGVDRWLAMVAACHQQPESALVVVDAGSAYTLDVVSEGSIHDGGYIVPGLGLQKLSLRSNTERVNFESEIDRSYALGRSTDECVNRGIVRSLVSLLDSVCNQLKKSGEGEPILFITGGDAAVIAPWFPNAIVRENMVLDGLAICYPVAMDSAP